MKAIPVIAALSLSFGLAGCAGSDTRSTYVAPETVTGVTTRTDARYVAEVEWIARQRGVRVHWVHPPVKRVDAVARR